MAELTASTTKNKSGFSRSHNRRCTRVDLTPMVDLGFLLITFFVFTTTMSEPRVMNLIEPRKEGEQPVKRSGAMTIMLGSDNKIGYYYGELDERQASDQIKFSNFKDIRTLILGKKVNTDKDYLMYIVKADSSSTFGNVIDILDEMSICGIAQGHYCEVDITAVESSVIRK